MNHPAFWTILTVTVVFVGVLLFIRSSRKRDAREAQARNEARERFEFAQRKERIEQDRLRFVHARQAVDRRANPLAMSAQGRAVPSADPRHRTDHGSDLLDPLNPLNPIHQAVLADSVRSHDSDAACSTKSTPSYSGYGSASESYGGSSSYASDSSSGSSDSGSSSCD